jgi:membrane protein YdbS with pleckstrin-like domain
VSKKSSKQAPESAAKSTQLNCFSPPVMLATLTVETMLVLYTVWRYKLNTLARLAVTALVGLAIFQASEYFVCTGRGGINGQDWSRLGFAAIAVLPPIGLHIMHLLADKPKRRLVTGAYVTMASFIGFFLLHHATFTGYECTGNYVIYQVAPWVGNLYYAYYYGWLAIGIFLGWQWANELLGEVNDDTKAKFNVDANTNDTASANLEARAAGKGKSKAMRKPKTVRKQLEAVRGLIIGYLVFLVPTTVANTVKPSTRRGIPSIMCGFAVLFALILTLYILPRAARQKHRLTFKLPELGRR